MPSSPRQTFGAPARLETARWLAAIAGCVLATGCATQYAPPPGSDTAELRISADQFFGLMGGSVRAVYYREGRCDKPEVMAVISKIHTSKSTPTALLPPMTPTEADTTVDRIVEANAPIHITLFSAKPGHTCSLPMTFSAEPKKAYQVRFYWDWTAMKCKADVAVFDPVSSSVAGRAPVAKQQNECKTGMDLPAL